MTTGPVIVVGGANLDIKAQSSAAVVTGTSNPGTALSTPGGVGRNIAENLARLGVQVELLAPIGTDSHGDALLEAAGAAGIGTDHVVRSSSPTGTYLAVLEPSGELVVAVASMQIMQTLTGDVIEERRGLIESAACVVIDGNISADVAEAVLRIAAEASVRVVIDPVSVPKATVMRTVLGTGPVWAITPNLDELASLVGRPVGHLTNEIAAAATELHDQGVEIVWVRDGADGSVLSIHPTGELAAAVHQLAAPPADVVDVTGAGDSGTAAFVYALLRGDDPADAARFGHRASALTVSVSETVRPDLASALTT